MSDGELSNLRELVLEAYEAHFDHEEAELMKQLMLVPTIEFFPLVMADQDWKVRAATIYLLGALEELLPGSRSEVVNWLENIILHDEDKEIRHSAMGTLICFKTDEAVDAAIKALIWDDENELDAFFALDHHPRETVLQKLKANLNSENALIHFKCAYWLVEFDSFENYHESINHPDSTVRLLSVCAARETKAFDFQTLQQHYAIEHDDAVRAACINLMGKLVDHNLVEPFIPVLSDPAEVVRRQALFFLWDSTDSLDDSTEAHQAFEKLLMTDDRFLRKKTIELAGYCNARNCIPMLIALLDDADGETAYFAADALGNLKATEAIPALMKRVRQDTEGSGDALRALHEIGDVSVIPELMELLQNRAYGHRESIAFTLGYLKDSRAYPLLLTLLADSTDSEDARGCAAQALSHFEQREVFDRLIDVLNETLSPRFMDYIVTALWWLKDARAEPYLVDLLHVNNPRIHYSVLRSLGISGSSASIPLLQKWLDEIDKDNNSELYRETEEVLIKLKSKHSST